MIFALSATAVVLAGARLSREGDHIAVRTGLGAAWVGAVLVAGATSLPELITDTFAVRAGDVDLAMGDLFGSSMTNMLILAVADLAVFRHRILTRVAVNQALVGALAISLTAIIVAGIVSGEQTTLLHIGWAPALALITYIAGVRLLHRNRAAPPFESAVATPPETSLSNFPWRSGAWFLLATVVILIAAPFLASSAADLADQWNVSQGFVGVVLLAITTSLPEVSVTTASIRSGSYDLAVGNLLGSNCFNMVIPFALDAVYGSGSLLAAVDNDVTVGAMFAILLTALSMMEILHRSERRHWLLEPDAIARIVIYALGIAIVFRTG